MHQIRVLNCLDVTSKGPVSTYTRDQVHLRQGELDGACGHYSMMMVLIMLGIQRFDDAWQLLSFNQDLRTKLGKFAKSIKAENFFLGTNPEDIRNIINTAFKNELETEVCKRSGVEIRKFVIDNLNEDKPVMLALDFKGGAHWVVAVGLDYQDEEDEKELLRFLVLDPGGSAPTFSAWNGVVNAQSKAGPYPYKWYNENDSRDVKFTYALSFSNLKV